MVPDLISPHRCRRVNIPLTILLLFFGVFFFFPGPQLGANPQRSPDIKDAKKWQIQPLVCSLQLLFNRFHFRLLVKTNNMLEFTHIWKLKQERQMKFLRQKIPAGDIRAPCDITNM